MTILWCSVSTQLSSSSLLGNLKTSSSISEEVQNLRINKNERKILFHVMFVDQMKKNVNNIPARNSTSHKSLLNWRICQTFSMREKSSKNVETSTLNKLSVLFVHSRKAPKFLSNSPHSSHLTFQRWYSTDSSIEHSKLNTEKGHELWTWTIFHGEKKSSASEVKSGNFICRLSSMANDSTRWRRRHKIKIVNNLCFSLLLLLLHFFYFHAPRLEFSFFISSPVSAADPLQVFLYRGIISFTFRKSA